MPLIPYERRQLILEQISKSEITNIDELLQLLPGVSASTIRRDLKALTEEGEIILLRGGAARTRKEDTLDLPVETKLLKNMPAKEKLAAYAASLVQDGDVIYIDSSTSVYPMLAHLKKTRLNIVTTSIFVPQAVTPGMHRCVLVGGDVAADFGSITGSITEMQLSQMYFDKAFMSANGFSLEHGVSSPHATEMAKMRLVEKNSQITYLLLDATKKNRDTLYKVFDLSQCRMITDQYDPILEECREHFVVK